MVRHPQEVLTTAEPLNGDTEGTSSDTPNQGAEAAPQREEIKDMETEDGETTTPAKHTDGMETSAKKKEKNEKKHKKEKDKKLKAEKKETGDGDGRLWL